MAEGYPRRGLTSSSLELVGYGRRAWRVYRPTHDARRPHVHRTNRADHRRITRVGSRARARSRWTRMEPHSHGTQRRATRGRARRAGAANARGGDSRRRHRRQPSRGDGGVGARALTNVLEGELPSGRYTAALLGPGMAEPEETAA